MPKQIAQIASKKLKKRRKSSGDPASSPAGPATEQARPAKLGKTVEVGAKASTRPIVAKAAILDDPDSVDAEKSASPKKKWTLHHGTIPEFVASMPKQREICFVFRDEYRQKGENTEKRQIFYSCRRKIAHEMEEINRRCSSSSGLCRFIFQLRWAFQNL